MSQKKTLVIKVEPKGRETLAYAAAKAVAAELTPEEFVAFQAYVAGFVDQDIKKKVSKNQ